MGHRVPAGEFRFFVAFVALCEETKNTSWLTRRHKGTKKKDFCITGKDRWKKLNLRQSSPSFSPRLVMSVGLSKQTGSNEQFYAIFDVSSPL